MFDKKAYSKNYYEKNKEILKQRSIQWNKDHPDKHYEHVKKCKQSTIIKGLSLKDYHKKYYEEHKEYFKNYRERNREKIRDYQKAYAEKRKQKSL